MSAARLILNRMIDELPDDILSEVINYIAFVQKTKKEVISKEYRGRAQCMVIRDNKILMVKHKHSETEWNYCLPGGGIEKGETPEQAAVRELQEECLISGKIIKKVSEYIDSFDYSIYTFQFDIGEQNPMLGKDPELPENNQILAGVEWLSLNEICERDRVFLWAAGLISSAQFTDEVLLWGNDISYPNK